MQALDAAFADERDVAVLVKAAEGAAVVLEVGAAERTVVALGLDQLPELALELAALLAAHPRPSASCQRPHFVLRSLLLSRMNQPGSLVGGIGMQRHPFSMSRSSAESGTLTSRVVRRSRTRWRAGREVMARPSGCEYSEGRLERSPCPDYSRSLRTKEKSGPGVETAGAFGI